jgi:hypothetical protein
MIEHKLRKNKNVPTVWSKYAWVANYHNFVCREQEGSFLDHLVDPALLQTMPARLFRPRGW